MKLTTVIILLAMSTNAWPDTMQIVNPEVAKTEGVTPVKSLTDARVENTVENIYAEIKAGKMERAHLLFLAAKRGYPNACLYAGYMFDNGIAVQKSPEKAFVWFQNCALKNPIAAYNLGVLYAEGRGTTKDMLQAVKWFKVAWPSLKSAVPQIPVRLGYYYWKNKSYDEAWEWAERASNANNKKHGDYLMAKMLATGKVQREDISQALNRSTNAMLAYNHNAAHLIAWIYAVGKTDETKDKALEIACSYESIATLMKGGQSLHSVRYCGGLSEEKKQRADDFARKMLVHQQKPEPMNFTGSLDGKEPQFKS